MSHTESRSSSDPAACANCGATLEGNWCGQCGQSRRANARLRIREIANHLLEDFLSIESSSLRTFVDLSRGPGEVCRGYVEGRRKRWMNPVAYFLLAATLTLLMSAILNRVWPSMHWSASEISDSRATNLQLASMVPLAVLWRWLFRGSGRNFAEVLVFALYISAQFFWAELLLTLPLAILLPRNEWAPALLFVPFVAFATWAAVSFFGESPTRTLGKVLASLAVVLVVGTIVVGLLDVTGIWPIDLSEPAVAFTSADAPAQLWPSTG